MAANPARLTAAASLVMLVAIAALTGSAAASTTTKKWYWAEDRAEAVLVAKFRMPYCRWEPNDAKVCKPTGVPLPGHPNLIGFQLGDASCTGADELGVSFKFSRFRCRVVSRYAPFFRSSIAVYPTGALTFRWKVLVQ